MKTWVLGRKVSNTSSFLVIGGAGFKGIIRDIRLYIDETLNQSDVNRLYQASLNFDKENLRIVIRRIESLQKIYDAQNFKIPSSFLGKFICSFPFCLIDFPSFHFF